MQLKSFEQNVILVVDDNPANLGVLSEVLDDAGFEVWVARDGLSAIQKVEYDQPHLILLDVMMPGIDGFETCHRLKSLPVTQDIPIIFMTALSEVESKVKGLTLGAVDYITKPFQQEEVLARVKLHLKLRNLNETLKEQNLRLKQEVEERKKAEASLQNLTQELEQRVEERTFNLQQALGNLQQAQVQLVQTEKLATLGQLIAGLAHEINNPVSCILGNLAHLDTCMQDIVEHLQLYQNHYHEPVDAIKDHAEEIEIDYLMGDLPQIISSMKFSTQRIQSLSVSLRNFYRSDTTSKAPFNLHEGLETTLLILQHRLKATNERPAIEVIKKYGDLPPVECYSGQINQVFMNMLANAIDALDEVINHPQIKDQRVLSIWIETEVVAKNTVAIRIIDNGKGIPETLQKQLFQPMFTTKPIGKGTGLGLSISRQIVEEKHQGRLRCNASVQEGAEFIIELPIKAVESV
jgi:signal transduction histidine kinase